MNPKSHEPVAAKSTSSSGATVTPPTEEPGVRLTPLDANVLEHTLLANLSAVNKVASLVPSLRVLIGLSISAIVILGLYYGRDLLIPLALATLFGLTLFSHQVGGFLGAYLGGVSMVEFGDYRWMWYADMVLAALAAVIHLPIREAKITKTTA